MPSCFGQGTTLSRGPAPLALLEELVGLLVGLRPRGADFRSVRKWVSLCKGSEVEMSNKLVSRGASTYPLVTVKFGEHVAGVVGPRLVVCIEDGTSVGVVEVNHERPARGGVPLDAINHDGPAEFHVREWRTLRMKVR